MREETNDGGGDESPSSEVGSQRTNNAHNDENKWRMLLEEQNRNLLAMVQALKTPTNDQRIRLPEFDPDKQNVDARAWINTADMCMEEKPLQGAALMIALSNAMKGQSATWLAQISFPGMTWAEFKDQFVSMYDCPETPAAFLINLSGSTPRSGECLAAYSARILTALMARWKNLTTEQIAVSTVLAHVAPIEPRVQRLAFTTNIPTRADMQRELKAISFSRKRVGSSNSQETSGPDTKRSKIGQQLSRCYTCGKLGHKSITCRFKSNQQFTKPGVRKDFNSATAGVSSTNKNVTNNEKPTNNSHIICFKCREVGHTAPRCPGRLDKQGTSPNVPATERRVDFCIVGAPRGVISHKGEQIPFYYDSGSECSLVKESVSGKLSGMRINNVVIMTGIGQTSVHSTLQILTTVTIDDIPLEILFHVLPDQYLRYDVMIGREILGQGITVNLTSTAVKLSRACTVLSCDIVSSDIDFNLVDTDIPLEFKPKLLLLLEAYKSNFVVGTPNTPANVEPMQIKLKDPNKTVCRRPYRLSADERKVVRAKINELLASNVVRPSSSPFASPVLLVKKKDDTDRMCVDYRELNDNTVPDRFPLPLISDQIDRLHNCYYFTILDMASGYHQVPVHPDSIEKTAFVTPEGQFEYLTMPFGLRNAPSIFQRAVIKALGELVNTFVCVYMDDILVLGGPDVNEAMGRVETVLETLTKVGFHFNIKKCSFLKQKVEYLGYEVSKGEIRPNTRKIEALVSLPPPKTVTQLRQFIGLASYFRQFIPKFSQTMAPLYAMTSSSKGDITWTPENEVIRQSVIKTLTSEPVLTLFDPDLDIELHTDASSIGYGAILMQVKNKKRHVIGYYSKRTTTAESKYHSYELETLAVVNAVKHYRHYLLGHKFVVYTDCNSLQASRKKLDLAPRVHRWWAFLQAFDFDVVHRAGTQMSHVDFFSRNPVPDPPSKALGKVGQMEVNLTNLPENWLLAEQQKDPEISELLKNINEHKLSDDVMKTYEIRSGVLHRKVQRNGRTRCLPILPRALRWSVINSTHNSLVHLGWEKTLEKVYDQFWFQHMAKYVRKFVEGCVTCKISKTHTGKIQAELHPIPKIAIPWHTIHIDATGKLSGKNDKKEYVFVLIDAFTKFALLYHTRNIDTVSSIKAVKQAVSLFGTPTRIIADQGRCFASSDFRGFCDSHNIKLHLIATGSSRANGQVERTMSTLKNMMTTVETSRDCSWQEALPDIQLALNCSMNRVTKFSPLELLIGKVARPLELMFADDTETDVDLTTVRAHASDNMNTTASYDKNRFDRGKAKIKKFEVGEYVLLQNEERNQTKLDAKYKGPFKVLEILDGDRYVLKSLTSRRTYKYAHDRLRKMPKNSPDLENSLNVDSEEESENSKDVN